jgi:hypothetical protein
MYVGGNTKITSYYNDFYQLTLAKKKIEEGQ